MASIAPGTVTISSVNMSERAQLGITSGDHVIVWQKIVEEVQEGKTTKMKSRLQAFEGDVIATKHGVEAGATFTVRREGAAGIGIERIFPLYSPMVDKIEIVRRSQVRRAKLYHIRNVASKKIKQTLRKMRLVGLSTLGSAELEAIAAKEAAAKAKIEAEEKAKADAIAAEAKAKADAEAVEAARIEAEQKAKEEAEAATAATVVASAPVDTAQSTEADDIVKWVEGIGPKIGEVFASAGITTFAQLAEADIETLKTLLADNSLASHDPATWPAQAALARDGKWDELKQMHAELDGGKVVA